MFGKASILVALFVGAGLAGCAAPSESAQAGDALAPAAPADFDESTGAITGLVTNDEAVPLAGAQVAIKSDAHEQSTLSDPTGKFTLSRIPPGTYRLFAQMLGYGATAKSIDVLAGEEKQANVVLVALAIQQGYASIWSKKGYFDCSTTLAGSTGPCGFLPVVGNVTYVADLFDTTRRAFEYKVGPGVMDVFNEVTWKQGSFATGEKLRNTFSYHNRTTTHWWCSSTGTNPMRFHWERSEDVEANEPGTCEGSGAQLPSGQPQAIPYKTGEMLRSFLNTGPARNPATGGDISQFGLAWQQNFEIWFSVFYWERAADDHSALKDA